MSSEQTPGDSLPKRFGSDIRGLDPLRALNEFNDPRELFAHILMHAVESLDERTHELKELEKAIQTLDELMIHIDNKLSTMKGELVEKIRSWFGRSSELVKQIEDCKRVLQEKRSYAHEEEDKIRKNIAQIKMALENMLEKWKKELPKGTVH